MTTLETPRIVIAYDGSPSARVGVLRAAELFAGAHATIVSVAQGLGALAEASGAARAALPDDMIREAVGRLRETALAEAQELAEQGCREAVDSGLRAEAKTVAAERSVSAAVAQAAEEAGADVIVCGTSGHGAAVRALVGSVALALVRHAQVPVLIVPEAAGHASGPVVVAFDGSPSALGAVRVAGSLFSGREALVVQVWKRPFRHALTSTVARRLPLPAMREVVDGLDRAAEASAEATTDSGLALALAEGLRPTKATVESSDGVQQTIMRVAREADAAVTVLGRRGLGTVPGVILGSVSTALMYASEGPVLIAHA